MKRAITSLMLTAALALPLAMLPTTSASAGVSIGISVGFGPPPLPWYPQPICPGYGYYWVPGYWAYGSYGYFWVPGAWIMPPAVGVVWTPGWWGWRGGLWFWYPGYWGRHVGFYGGIAYGHGYNGHGYHGGYWRHGRFHYNRAVTHLKPSLLHDNRSYNQPVRHPVRQHKRTSYNGGKHGVNLLPTAAQKRLAKSHHIAATPMQQRHIAAAKKNPKMRLANNHGHPVIPNKRPVRPVKRPETSPSLLANNGNNGGKHKPDAQKGSSPTSGHEKIPVFVANPKPVHAPVKRPVKQPISTPRPVRPEPPAHKPVLVTHPQPKPIREPRPHPVKQPVKRPIHVAPLKPTHRPVRRPPTTPRPVHVSHPPRVHVSPSHSRPSRPVSPRPRHHASRPSHVSRPQVQHRRVSPHRHGPP